MKIEYNFPFVSSTFRVLKFLNFCHHSYLEKFSKWWIFLYLSFKFITKMIFSSPFLSFNTFSISFHNLFLFLFWFVNLHQPSHTLFLLLQPLWVSMMSRVPYISFSWSRSYHLLKNHITYKCLLMLVRNVHFFQKDLTTWC